MFTKNYFLTYMPCDAAWNYFLIWKVKVLFLWIVFIAHIVLAGYMWTSVGTRRCAGRRKPWWAAPRCNSSRQRRTFSWAARVLQMPVSGMF